VLLSAVAAVLDRDLRTLRREVEAYPDDASLWQTVPGISNVAGTLALHLAGNIQHYLGARLAGTDYVRDRAAEFSRRDVSRSELLREIEAARAAVKRAAGRLTESELQAEFPESIAGMKIQTGEYLLHLATHFTYHLGQLDYHRRMVTESSVAVDAVRPAELSTARPA
jgi:uncharacterized damage-inducible protein DinB